MQVTLQILTALIEKCPRDLPLYSGSVLTILNTVVHSKDISMIEESIPTFETYCKYLDASSWAADKARAQQYLDLVQEYSRFASKMPPADLKVSPSPPVAIRWRAAGLRAIRSVVGSEAFGGEPGQQLSIVMPVILENLHSETDDILASLQHKAQTSEKIDVEKARQRRMSIATVATVDTAIDANPATASGTTADADQEAENEVRVLAVRCLKHIFTVGTGSSRGQIRLATVLTLRFIALRNPPLMTVAQTTSRMGQRGNWATSLIETVARWTPVQDRFIIVVTAMETLVRSPIMESMLEKQLALATMIDWLLSSSINLIGLSVMDVLLGFVQHTLLLLQLGGRDSKITPHHQQLDALDLYQDAKETFEKGSPFHEPERGRSHETKEATPSPVRQELLLRLQKCIGDLATHIYYTDQVSDMLTAILARLKPSVQSDVSSAAAAIDDPVAAAKEIARSASLQEDHTTDEFFSFATARVTALRAIKDILITANFRKSMTGASAEARSRVGAQVWEGTQWLLRDDDREVRFAYVDALLTWLKLETNKTDQTLPKEGPRKPKHPKKSGAEDGDTKLAKRAASNASRKDTKPPARSSFVQLLHLAVYDNALGSPENEADILLLHLLLSNLVERLGVNSVKSGLPMICQLQETVLKNDYADAPEAKCNVASLVHGYFWTLTEKFDLEGTRIGSEINAEIARRKRSGIWLDRIRFPALTVEHITTNASSLANPGQIHEEALGTLKPFLNRFDLVLEIANAYDSSLVTPPISPPASPGRMFSVPTLGFGYGYGVSPAPRPSPEHQMSQNVKDEMLFDWSREACIAAVEQESRKTASITGSRTGASSGNRNQLLTVNGTNGKVENDLDSPITAEPETMKEDSPPYPTFGGLSSIQKLRSPSTNGSPGPMATSSSRESVVRVSDLKRALAGVRLNNRHASPLRRPVSRPDSLQSRGSESMVSYHDAGGTEGSTQGVDGVNEANGPVAGTPRPPSSSSKKDADATSPSSVRQTYHDIVSLPRINSDLRLGDDVPPVPKIPSAVNIPGTFPRDASPARVTTSGSDNARSQSEFQEAASGVPRAGVNGGGSTASLREGRSMRRGNTRPTTRQANAVPATLSGIPRGRIDLEKLLAGISTMEDSPSQGKASSGSSISKPPY